MERPRADCECMDGDPGVAGLCECMHSIGDADHVSHEREDPSPSFVGLPADGLSASRQAAHLMANEAREALLVSSSSFDVKEVLKLIRNPAWLSHRCVAWVMRRRRVLFSDGTEARTECSGERGCAIGRFIPVFGWRRSFISTPSEFGTHIHPLGGHLSSWLFR